MFSRSRASRIPRATSSQRVIPPKMLKKIERLDMSRYPIVVRLDGTNAEDGRRLLTEAGNANIHPEATMLDGARRAVELAKKAA